MKNLFLIIALFALFSCKQNERLIFSSDNKIYFRIKSSLDTLSFSLLTKENGHEYDIPVALLGNKLSAEKKYKVEVDMEKSTAKEGIHYSLEHEFMFPVDTFASSFKVKLFKTDLELASKIKFLVLRLVPSDLNIAYEDRSSIVIALTATLRPPTGTGYYGDLGTFERLFGVYSRKKHELIIEIVGHDFWDGDYGDYGGAEGLSEEEDYYKPYARILYQYITDNVVYDENGVQVKPW